MADKDRSSNVKFVLRTHNVEFRTYNANEFTADDMMVHLTKLAMTEKFTGSAASGMIPPRSLRTLLLRQTKV